MVKCAEAQCPSVLGDAQVSNELRKSCEKKCSFSNEIVHSAIVDQAGTDIINKIRSVQLFTPFGACKLSNDPLISHPRVRALRALPVISLVTLTVFFFSHSQNLFMTRHGLSVKPGYFPGCVPGSSSTSRSIPGTCLISLAWALGSCVKLLGQFILSICLLFLFQFQRDKLGGCCSRVRQNHRRGRGFFVQVLQVLSELSRFLF
jgi:hypothetical protein